MPREWNKFRFSGSVCGPHTWNESMLSGCKRHIFLAPVIALHCNVFSCCHFFFFFSFFYCLRLASNGLLLLFASCTSSRSRLLLANSSSGLLLLAGSSGLLIAGSLWFLAGSRSLLFLRLALVTFSATSAGGDHFLCQLLDVSLTEFFERPGHRNQFNHVVPSLIYAHREGALASLDRVLFHNDICILQKFFQLVCRTLEHASASASLNDNHHFL